MIICAGSDTSEMSHQLACMMIVKHPTKWFVSASAGFNLPGMKETEIKPSFFQSMIAKCGMEIWRNRSVGATASTIFLVEALSS